MSYTPGPWKMTQHPDNSCPAISIGTNEDSYSEGFATVWLNSGANARLIAAAPELYDIVEWFLLAAAGSGVTAVENSNDPVEAAMFRAQTVLAKAKGE